MNLLPKILVGSAALAIAFSLQAHEGHAPVGTVAHGVQHAGWVAAALVMASVLLLTAFCTSARFMDKQISDKKRRD